jgi:hypothetical protein
MRGFLFESESCKSSPAPLAVVSLLGRGGGGPSSLNATDPGKSFPLPQVRNGQSAELKFDERAKNVRFLTKPSLQIFGHSFPAEP